MRWKPFLVSLAVLSASLPALAGPSFYTLRPNDPAAVSLVRGQGGLTGDGVADDSDAIQAAINKVQETTGQGIVLLPEGRYRLSKTIFVWPGIRVIGYGATRPVLVLGKNTPGYQQGIGYMVMLTGNRPPATGPLPKRPGRPAQPIDGIVPPNDRIPDANPGTFYTALSNIDFEIQEGNPAAVGARLRVAQHSYLAHMDFHIGSGLAGLHDVGNEAEDLHFYGGQYGIMTRKPSPGWQFTLLDATFDGQSKAAIKEHEAGLTLIRAQIRNTPTAISIDPEYSEELWVKDSRFENISGPAVIISNEHGLRTEINLEDVYCRNVPTLANLRESNTNIPGRGEIYHVHSFTHGLTFDSPSSTGEVKTHVEGAPLKAMPEPVPSDIPSLPPQETWANLKDLGAKGDGTTDDTAAIRQAIATHRVLYIPTGRYIVTDTITLKPDTILIGLHPSKTLFEIPDNTPAFQGPGSPKPLLEAPKGGTNIVTGIGLYTNGINSRAVAAKWMAGTHSMMDDVRFLGGHGTSVPGMTPIYNNTHTADTDLNRKWDSQYPSLWITDGGGGTFANIWTPSTFAQAGMLISNTTTEGRVYELSSEHHVRNEIKVDHASNWKIYSLQTEEERGEGPFCLPLSITNSSDITVANYHSYRVVSSYQPYATAIHVANSKNIRFRNIHIYGDNKASFDNGMIVDFKTPVQLRNREFAFLTVDTSKPEDPEPTPASPVLAPGSRVERLATGFYNISGGAVDPDGKLYFVDPHWQRIFHWLPEEHRADLVRDSPVEPTQLVFDRAGNLMVVSYQGNGTVYTFKPEQQDEEITLLKPQPAAPRPGMTPVVPLNYWRNENDFIKSIPVPRPFQYISPDNTTFIPAGADFVNGDLYYGIKMADLIRAFGLGKAIEGKPVYISEESMQKTYSAELGPDGSYTSIKLFAETGGESVAQDAAGNVYIANGQVYVYNPSGELIDTIKVPERPINLIFGGKGGKTLYILARTSLYSVETK
jgi:hypothetical protein